MAGVFNLIFYILCRFYSRRPFCLFDSRTDTRGGSGHRLPAANIPSVAS